jgi:hypothetical protein
VAESVEAIRTDPVVKCLAISLIGS